VANLDRYRQRCQLGFAAASFLRWPRRWLSTAPGEGRGQLALMSEAALAAAISSSIFWASSPAQGIEVAAELEHQARLLAQRNVLRDHCRRRCPFGAAARARYRRSASA